MAQDSSQDFKQSALLDKEQEMSDKEVLRHLWRYAKPYYGRYIAALISLVLIAASNAGFAKLMENMITAVEEKAEGGFIAPLILLFVFFVRAVSTISSTYLLSWIGQRVVMNVRIDLFNHIIAMPSRLFDQIRQSEMISIISNRTTTIATATSNSTIIVFQDFFTILGLVMVMLYQSLFLSISILIALPFMVHIFVVTKKMFVANSANMQRGDAQATGKIIEAIKGYRSIRIYNAGQQESTMYQSVVKNMFRAGLRFLVIRSVISPLMQFMVMLIFILIVYLSTLDYFSEHISGAVFVSFLFALFMTLTPLKRLSQFSATYYQIMVSGKSLFSFLHTDREKDTGTVEMQYPQGRIEYKNISFAYHEKEPVLQDVSFTLAPSSMVALVGRSGSGKSTTLNLIPRFYEASSGQILIDRRPIEEYTLQSLRKHISYVGQDIILNDASIYENISYGELDQTNPQLVEAACKRACAHDFISALPEGYDTVLDNSGQLLSGGQRQRIAIARAFLKEAKIVLMDEPTSALDNESDKEIRYAIAALKEQSSIVVIAHRLATTKMADTIVVLDKGKVVEQGTHVELSQKGGLYHHLCETAIQ